MALRAHSLSNGMEPSRDHRECRMGLRPTKGDEIELGRTAPLRSRLSNGMEPSRDHRERFGRSRGTPGDFQGSAAWARPTKGDEKGDENRYGIKPSRDHRERYGHLELNLAVIRPG